MHLGSDPKKNDWKEMLVCKFSGGEVTETLCSDTDGVDVLLESFDSQVTQKKGFVHTQ